MSDGILLIFGWVVSLIAASAIYDYTRARFAAHRLRLVASKPETVAHEPNHRRAA